VPVFLVVMVALGGLYVSGLESLKTQGIAGSSMRDIIDASDPFTVLLWASLVGVASAVALAVLQGVLSLRQALEAMVGGFKSMLMAVVVLVLAWSLGDVCVHLGTADFLVAAVGPRLPVVLLPAAVFAVSACVAFATGTSWGTMAILTPLAIPLVLQAEASPGVIAATASAILGGAVFGDHCSPISDTTVMSSMASSCDHVDHVRTQLPYALLGAVVALVVGYIPASVLGIPPWILLPVGLGVIVVWIAVVGKPSDQL